MLTRAEAIHLLKTDVSGWNLARSTSVEIPSLAGANLTRTNLAGVNLSEANLYRANLKGANLWRANLKGADLCRANLSWADLAGADLTRADLKGAILGASDLAVADLSWADLTEADLHRANLKGTDLTGARLNFDSHALISEALRRAAGESVAKCKITGFVAIRTDLCWDAMVKRAKPKELAWVLEVLAGYVVSPDQELPEILAIYVACARKNDSAVVQID